MGAPDLLYIEELEREFCSEWYQGLQEIGNQQKYNMPELSASSVWSDDSSWSEEFVLELDHDSGFTDRISSSSSSCCFNLAGGSNLAHGSGARTSSLDWKSTFFGAEVAAPQGRNIQTQCSNAHSDLCKEIVELTAAKDHNFDIATLFWRFQNEPHTVVPILEYNTLTYTSNGPTEFTNTTTTNEIFHLPSHCHECRHENNSPTKQLVGKKSDLSRTKLERVSSRRKANEKARTILMDWIHLHKDHPYPTKQQKEELSNSTGLSVPQVVHWMSNVRKRRIIPLFRAKRKPSSNVDKRFIAELEKREKSCH